jgi:hypothetical protein
MIPDLTILSKKHKHIARIDQETKKTHGWYVRVMLLGISHSKFFSDRKYGGKNYGLHTAILWRNEVEKKLGKVCTKKRRVKVSGSDTGVVGVSLNRRMSWYEVSWMTEQGKKGGTSVSIARHGKREAFFKACSIRRERKGGTRSNVSRLG